MVREWVLKKNKWRRLQSVKTGSRKAQKYLWKLLKFWFFQIMQDSTSGKRRYLKNESLHLVTVDESNFKWMTKYVLQKSNNKLKIITFLDFKKQVKEFSGYGINMNLNIHVLNNLIKVSQ